MVVRRAVDDRPETLVGFAQRRIKTAIASGAIQPGDRLSAQLLAPEFGLSHIPVREALVSLTAAGYVVHRRGRGFFARELTAEDLIDIHHWRAVLEHEAYRLAVPKMTPEDFEEMHSLIARMAPLTGSSDRLEYLEVNRDFHFVAFRRVGAHRLLRFLNWLWDSAQPYGALEMTDSSKSHEEHIAMMPLFEAGDTEAVIEAMDAHRGALTDRVVRWETSQTADS